MINSDNWIPSDGIILERAAEFAVKSDENILITAGPGAGKTELLAQKANFLFTTGKCLPPYSVLALSFKNDSASNLKKRVNARTLNKYSNRFDSLTFDSFFKMILDHFIGTLPPEIRPPYDYTVNNDDLVKEALNVLGMTWKYNSDFFRYMDDLEYIDFSYEKSNIRPLWDYLLEKSIMTNGMIRALARWIVINRPKIRRSIQNTYQYVFLDEFQDTTPIQYEIVKTVFGNTDTRITAVGDEKQKIMLWAGAMKDAFSRYLFDFSARKISLTANHRSSKNLVDLQSTIYSLVDKNVLKSDNVLDISNKNTGAISLLHTSSAEEEAVILAKMIKKRISEGVNASDICILIRANLDKYSRCLIRELSNLGIKARTEEKYQELLNDPVIKLVLSILELSLIDSSPYLWTEMIDELSSLKGVDLSDTLSVLNFTQTIEQELSTIRDKSLLWMDKQDFSDLIMSILEFIGIDDITAKYQRYNSAGMIHDLAIEFSDLFYEILIDSWLDWNIALSSFRGEDTVKIMTIHKSKGLEFNTVIVLALEDKLYFNIKRHPEEEISTLYVAISRAKEKLIFTYSDFRSYTVTWKFNGKQSKKDLDLIYKVLLSTPGLVIE